MRLRFIILVGVVNLFADLTYEGPKRLGPFQADEATVRQILEKIDYEGLAGLIDR